MRTMKKCRCVFMMLAMLLTATVHGQSEPVEAKQKVAPKKIVLNTKRLELNVGDTARLSVKSVKPKKAVKKVTWKSKNKKIATVTKKGKIKAKKAGTTIITARSHQNKKIKATVKVVVKKQQNSQKPVVQTPTQSRPSDKPEKIEKECGYQASVYRNTEWLTRVSENLQVPYTILYGKGNHRLISTKEEWDILMMKLSQYVPEDIQQTCFAPHADTDFAKYSIVLYSPLVQPYITEHRVTAVKTVFNEAGQLCGEIEAECRDVTNPDYDYPDVLDYNFIILQLEKSDAEMIDCYELKEKIIQ